MANYGVSLPTTSLRRIEEGSQRMKLEEAMALARIFHMGLEEFITEPVNGDLARLMTENRRVVAARRGMKAGVLNYQVIFDELPAILDSVAPEHKESSLYLYLEHVLEEDAPIADYIKALNAHIWNVWVADRDDETPEG